MPSSLSEDERMRRVLDRDEYERRQFAKYANLLSSQDEAASTSSGAIVDDITFLGRDGRHRGDRSIIDRVFQRGGSQASNSSAAGQFHDWPDSDSRGSYSQVSSNNGHHERGVLDIITVNCLPSSRSRPSADDESKRTKQQRRLLPALLLALILYGTISMILDVSNSIQSFQSSRTIAQQSNQRFPGGFIGVDGTRSAAEVDSSTSNIGSKKVSFNLKQARSFDLRTTMDEPMSDSFDKNNPTMNEVPLLTDEILSTTFQHTLDYSKNDQPYENEVMLFWTFGNTMDGLFKNMRKCFPNVVQASGGNMIGKEGEKSVHRFPGEVKIIQQRTSLDESLVVDGGRYVNVDLFNPDGVKRAADLQLLFPSTSYPLVHENDYTSVKTNGESLDEATIAAHSMLASRQIHLLVSPFLPEVASGLFALPAGINYNKALPKTRIHSIMLPTSNRVRSFHQIYTSQGGTQTYLQFITSSTIFVNNYVTRILSGQWEEGSPVTEIHLEVAKNVVAKKVHMWPNRGSSDMFSFMANMYGWQDGAMQHHQKLLQQFPQLGEKELKLGLDCMFPPPDPNAAPPEPPKVPPPAPTDLEVEIDKILNERNALDNELFYYVVQIYDDWMAA